MELKDLKHKLKERLVEVEQKVQEVNEVLKTQETPSKELVDEYELLKKKKDEILLQYDQIEAMDTEVEVRMPELEKSIYSSLRSFDSAYTKAGALMEKRKFKSGRKSVDFKNPYKNK